jgi:uncharacterized protein (TIGR00252 family)
MHLPAAIRSRWAKFWQPKPLGYLGERAAEKYLKRQGYKIVARGLLLRGGELDLVAVDGRTIVFVEVKTRRSAQFGLPAEAVSIRKQVYLTRAALFYLKRHGCWNIRRGLMWWRSRGRKMRSRRVSNTFRMRLKRRALGECIVNCTGLGAALL